MQELLARLKALDPQASMSLRIIACFDELVRGNVNTQAMLGAAASMAGTIAGVRGPHHASGMRVGPDGEVIGGPTTDDAPAPDHITRTYDATTVWLERPEPPSMNDEMILERLSLAVAVRFGVPRPDARRALASLLDPRADAEARRDLAAQLGLSPHRRHRIVALPLFATWGAHPEMPEDVVATQHGPIHVGVAGEDVRHLDARPCGIGAAVPPDKLHRSLESALVALRLCRPPATPVVLADDYGGILELLARSPADQQLADAALLDTVMARPWAEATLDALVRTTSVREAARAVSVHHSTMQTRLEEITDALGFDPLDGLGRTRLGIAFLSWRLHHSTVLDAPAPAAQP